MMIHSSSDADRDFVALAQASWAARLIGAPARHLRRAWASSRSRLAVIDTAQGIARLSRAQRVRLAGITGAVAMTTHVVLVLLDARSVEPLALLLPCTVLAACVSAIALADRIARRLERLG